MPTLLMVGCKTLNLHLCFAWVVHTTSSHLKANIIRAYTC
jgi:hypothetical protein